MKKEKIGQPFTREEFAEKYKALCKEAGLMLSFEPVWAKSADLGDYRLVIRVAVVELKQ